MLAVGTCHVFYLGVKEIGILSLDYNNKIGSVGLRLGRKRAGISLRR